MQESKAFEITPDMKVSALLKDFPQTEEVLVGLSPAFAKLRNPVLRRTIAKITSLRQAAQIGNVQLGKLINDLRKAAGMEEVTLKDEGSIMEIQKPEWFDKNNIKQSFDARGMIESGGHPLTKVMEDLEKSNDGSIYELITPFLPAPLIDVVKTKGFKVWSEETGSSEYHTYIINRNN